MSLSTESLPRRNDLVLLAQSLPSAPRIFAHVSALLADMNSSVEDITTLLKRDAALTARVLRVSNSVAYAGEQPVAALDEAVQRIGFGETYRIAGFATAAQIATQQLPFYGVSAAQFRENALLTALIMEQLAHCSDMDARSAYTAGLLRSVGKVALDRLQTSKPETAHSFEADGAGPLLEWEAARCGIHNAQAAGLILEEWRFPADTCQAVREHYLTEESASPLAILLNLAAGAAERCGHGWRGEWHYWENAASHREALSLNETDIDEATRAALQEFGPVRTAIA
jgi:HD-like signal output (HDOD) protein